MDIVHFHLLAPAASVTMLGMPHTARASQGGYCYHDLNRGNGRRTVFHKDGDYVAFGEDKGR